jgi:outer membrane protein OmpA-like peptidoglycan-associated protein
MKLRTISRMAAVGLASGAALGLAGCESMKRVQQAVYSPCHETSVTLYFDTASDNLTDAGKQIVSLTSKRLRSCQVQELRLVGLTDPAGTPAANVELSQRRANNVLDAFVRAGTPVPHYTLVASGALGAVTPTGAVEPLRRRVDVTVVVKK